jgi:2,3-dihydroxy-p-cumate/2,3-dihydroxybenzoate 3,4-dioxygenase
MIRYKRLGYIALNVSDLEKSSNFYHSMVGLTLTEKTENASFFRCSDSHHDIILYRSHATPGIKRVAFCLESPEALEQAVEYLKRQQVVVQPLPEEEQHALRQGKTFRFQEPNTGLTIEFFAEMEKTGVFQPIHTKIARLGHIVFSAERFKDALGFFTGVLNFKVSDYMEDKAAFLRCFPNPYHHSFALTQGVENRLNHINFMVTDIDDIGIAKNRLLAHNVPIVFGPGRHLPSTSIFLYFLDPDGITLEYSFGMEEFPEVNARDPRRLNFSLEVLDQWGSQPDPRMGKIGAIEVV